VETTIPFNILLLPLLGGFAFVSTWNYTRWHAVRASRERLIFYAALAGFCSLGVVFSAKILFGPFVPPGIPKFWHDNIPFDYSGVSVAAMVLASVMGFLLNQTRWFDTDTQARRIVTKEGGPLEQFLDVAMGAQKDVLVTMTNGKVYLGLMASSFVPDQRDQTITLLPIWSGFRDNGSQKITFTTDYESVYAKMELDYPGDHEQRIEDFRMTIPIRELRTVTFFSKDLHRQYFGGQRIIN